MSFCTHKKINCSASVYATEMKNILLETLFIIEIKTYLMQISIDARYIGSILNAATHDICQFFGNITIGINGKVGFLNFRCSINCPLSQTTVVYLKLRTL